MPSDRALSDPWLIEKIQRIDDASRGALWTSQHSAELLLEHDVYVGRKRVALVVDALKMALAAGARTRADPPQQR